jgi:hypothetical protein
LERESTGEAEGAAAIQPTDADTVILITRFALSEFSNERKRQVTVQELRA